MSQLRARLRADRESGFGLIETVVALLIAGIVFGALATTLIAAVQASLYGRQNQQATDFMTRALEQSRTADFGTLSHTAADLAGDPRLSACAAGTCLTVNGTPEPVVISATGGITPHIKVLTGTETNMTPFTVSTYVTKTADQPSAQARRVTVYVTWVSKGLTKTRSTTTLVAYTQKGLPLPVFKLEPPTSTVSINPGSRVTFPLTLTNQGAPDRWNLTLSGAATGWSWYADTDSDGALDTSVDTVLTDTTADGIVDTGRINPSTTFRFFMTRSTNSSETLGTKLTTITATSSGQPTATGAAKSVTATTVVTGTAVTPTPTPTPTPTAAPEVTCAAAVPGVVTKLNGSYTTYEYPLHSTNLGDTVLQAQMYFDGLAADEGSLPRYSTNVDPAATGRILTPTGLTLPTAAASLLVTDTTKYADWAMQQPSAVKIDGTGVLRLWVARYGAGTAPVSMKVVLYTATGSGSGLTRTAWKEATVVLPMTCAGFQEVYVTLPDAAQKDVAVNAWYGVRVVTAGTDNVRLAYDVPSQFNATFSIGVK